MEMLPSMRNLRRSALSIRSGKSHLSARLSLRDEKVYYKVVVPVFVPVYLVFSILDSLIVPGKSWIFFFSLRLVAFGVCYFCYNLTRSRFRYGLRCFLSGAAKVYCIEYIMISNHLTMTPYFAGFGLAITAWGVWVSTRFKVGIMNCFALVLPVLVYFTFFSSSVSARDLVLIWFMTIGTAVVVAMVSAQFHREIVERFIAQEALARDRGKRGEIIQAQVQELYRRKIFESQFSPQVVDQVLRTSGAVTQMRRSRIATVVVDIENSTKKSRELSIDNYKRVIEEVFDVFTSACLKCNVTIDKFTGDGAQAFSGAPIAASLDSERAVLACYETIRMLFARKKELEIIWGSELNVRFSVSVGEALVGFFGRGSLKSYTAIGERVSLAHRICSKVDPWSIGVCGAGENEISRLPEDLDSSNAVYEDLKGFDNKPIHVKVLRFVVRLSESRNLGRCIECGTPLVLDDQLDGIMRVICPGCQSRGSVGEAA